MKPGAPWSIKGIEPEAREAAKEKAREAGMTLGQWLNQTIADAGASRPAEPVAAPAGGSGSALETARIMRAIAEVARRVDVAAAGPADHTGIDVAALDRLEARLDELATAIPDDRPQLDQTRLERGLVAIARRIDQVEKSVRTVEMPEDLREEIRNLAGKEPDTAALDQSISNLGGQLEQLASRLSGIEQQIQHSAQSGDESPAETSAVSEQIAQDVRKLMNGMVNLAAKIERVESRFEADLQSVQSGIRDLPPTMAAQNHEERQALESRLDAMAGPASTEADNAAVIQAAVAAAMAPIARTIDELRERLDSDREALAAVSPEPSRPDTEPEKEPDSGPDVATDDWSEVEADAPGQEDTRSEAPASETDEDANDNRSDLSGLASLHDLTRADDIQVRPFDDDDGFFRDVDAGSAAAEDEPPADPVETPAPEAPTSSEPVRETEPDIPAEPAPAAPEPLDHIPDDANPPDRPRRLVPVESLLAGPGPGGRSGGVAQKNVPRSEPSLSGASALPEPAPESRQDSNDGGNRKPFRLDEPLDLSRQAPAPPPSGYPGRRRWVGYLLVALFFLALFIGGFWFTGTAQFRDVAADAGKLWDQTVSAVMGLDLDSEESDGAGAGSPSAEATQATLTPAPAPAAPTSSAATGDTAEAANSPTAGQDTEQVAALQPQTETTPAAPAAKPAPPVPEAEKTELEKLRDKARAGDADAQFAMGVRHRDGIGVEPSYANAAEWFDLAAQQGHVPAQLGLGIMYRQGLGRPRDMDLAKLWLHAAARAGDPDAQKLLGEVYVDDTAGVPDYFQAARWFREAAEQGVVDAQYNMGVLYEGGLGVPRDFSQAYYWFSLAANAGDKSAPEDRERNAQLLTPEQRAELDQQVAGFKAATAPAPAASASSDGDDAILQRRDEIRTLQQLLIARGYDPGTPDGIPGAKTRQAILQWQTDQGMTKSGQVTRKVLESLEAGG